MKRTHEKASVSHKLLKTKENIIKNLHCRAQTETDAHKYVDSAFVRALIFAACQQK